MSDAQFAKNSYKVFAQSHTTSQMISKIMYGQTVDEVYKKALREIEDDGFYILSVERL